ncbi:MAG TPA: alpha/beta fold hydrolase [Solirubrobacteraceae bacterium]|nr:alpha/beta fold hydrolase [Solirubrobacteraceae bacterium]
MISTATRAFYLTSGIEPVYALFDAPAAPTDGILDPATAPNAAASGGTSATGRANGAPAVGVLLCPLFGNDDLCAYRARREWAKTLAAAGHPTLRIDLPGTGNSAGGPYDPGRLRAWTDAVAVAAAWLRTRPGCARVTAIGIGIGGLLVYKAAAADAQIDDLVLWSTPARGKTFVRQLRVLSKMEASRATAGDTSEPALPQGALSSAGFVISAETVAALEALDLAELELPGAASRRVLLLERDGLEVDARLRASLERSGAEVALAPGPGYGRMVTPPQQSRAPVEVFARVQAWLAAGAGAPAPEHAHAPLASDTGETLELLVGGVRVRESPLSILCNEGRLAGVLAEGEDDAGICAVFLNAGALRHIGPNRMWVETARRWAARGVPTLRIDLAGIGDSDGDAGALERDEGLYVPRYVAQTLEVLDALAETGLPPRFLLAGLCSGAYWGLHAALADERVRAVVMINPRALFWDRSVSSMREARNVRKALRADTWAKLVRGQITAQRARAIGAGVAVVVRSLPARALANWRAWRTGGDRLHRALERLQASDTRLLGIFTASEPVLEELTRNGGLARMRARANVRICSIPGPLRSHTLEPLPLQRAVSALLDEELDRALGAAARGAGTRERQLSAPAR